MTAQVATLTKLGTSLIMQAIVNATPFSITSVRVISSVLSCTGDETAADFASPVYTRSNPSCAPMNSNVLRCMLDMDASVGTFDIGTVGLFSGSNLIALAAFPGAGQKIASNLPTSLGNLRTLLVDVQFALVATAIASAGLYPQPAIQNFPSPGATQAVDLTMGDVKINVGAHLTINASAVGTRRCAIVFVKTSALSILMTFGTNFKTQGGLALGGGAGTVYVIEFVGDGTTAFEIARSPAGM